MKNSPTLMVVVAVALVRSDGRILMQRRRPEKQHGGLWEFPGGKVESGETPENALIREIEEELAVRLNRQALAPLTFASAPREDAGGPIVILLYTCSEWTGDPQALDADALDWYLPSELSALSMPPLDVVLARALKLAN